MVVAAQKSGFSREFFHDKIGLTKIGEFAFDSERKMMSVIYKQGPRTDQMLPSVFNNSSCFIMAKGAPEGILSKSTHYLASPNSNKSVFDFVENTPDVPMSNAFLQLVSRNSSRMAESGLRVLALAIRKVSLVDAQSIYQSKKSTESEQNLTFVGLIGLIDPPK